MTSKLLSLLRLTKCMIGKLGELQLVGLQSTYVQCQEYFGIVGTQKSSSGAHYLSLDLKCTRLL